MRIIVVGGGVIGLSAAWRLAQDGHQAVVLDGAPGASEASWAAAGMLAPHHEARELDDRWALGVHALERWPAFAQALGGAEALDYHLGEGLVPCRDAAELAAEAARAAALATAGVTCRYRDASELRRHEPALAPQLLGAWSIPGGQVDPRRLLLRLHAACHDRQVELRYGAGVAGITPEGVQLSQGGTLPCDLVVVASGAWSVALARSTGIALSGEPVKGQMVRLQAPDGLLRHFVHAHAGYLVPRWGRGVVVGSTMVETGFDRSEDGQAVAQLVAAARDLVPELAEASVAETWTGLRPRLVGGRPLIARIHDRLIIATGHFRNGILLSSATAEAIADLAAGRDIPVAVRPFSRYIHATSDEIAGASSRPSSIPTGAMDGRHPDR